MRGGCETSTSSAVGAQRDTTDSGGALVDGLQGVLDLEQVPVRAERRERAIICTQIAWSAPDAAVMAPARLD